jgi:hypothetical protein
MCPTVGEPSLKFSILFKRVVNWKSAGNRIFFFAEEESDLAEPAAKTEG